jgi:hypothetical protein
MSSRNRNVILNLIQDLVNINEIPGQARDDDAISTRFRRGPARSQLIVFYINNITLPVLCPLNR